MKPQIRKCNKIMCAQTAIGIAVIAVLVSGCAVSQVNLRYTPGIQKRPQMDISVSVLPLSSSFALTSPIGQEVNAFGNAIAEFTLSDRVLQELGDAIKTELDRAGYTVTNTKSDLVIQPSLSTLSCNVDYVKGNTAELTININLSDRGNGVFSEPYEGTAYMKYRTAFGQCDELLAESARKAIENFIADLDAYIKS